MQFNHAKARMLRAHMRGPRIVTAVGAHNGLTARIVEQAGFDAVWASSFELSASHGLPDASLVTMTQYLDAAEMMDAATTIPIIADCDTGFGGPLNVAHTVERFERRGIAAVCIEDKVFPKLNSFADGRQDLVPVRDFAAKIRAGKASQLTPDFVLIARTEALICGESVEHALERAYAYAEAGADAVLVHSKSQLPDDILEFGIAWKTGTPLIAVPTTYGVVSERELFAVGYRIVIYANHGLRAAVRGMQNALAQIKENERCSDLDEHIATVKDVFELQGLPRTLAIRDL